MSSPFSTFEEFSSAEGPIYTFANNSAVTTIFLILSVLITIYFVYASYQGKHDVKAPSAKAIGLLLVAGASVMGTLLNFQSDRREAVNSRPSSEIRAERPGTWQPLTLLGLVGLGGTKLGATKGRSGRRSSRKPRSSRRGRSL